MFISSYCVTDINLNLASLIGYFYTIPYNYQKHASIMTLKKLYWMIEGAINLMAVGVKIPSKALRTHG